MRLCDNLLNLGDEPFTVTTSARNTTTGSDNSTDCIVRER